MAKLDSIHKKWGDKSIFEGFSLEIADGKITALLGRSGVGKTTLLNVIANLISYDGKAEGFGRVSYVFQEHRLIPFMTVRENIEYVLIDAIRDKNANKGIIDRVLPLVGLEKLQNRYPDKLSGGEKQRVALARAFAYPADTVLLDEPLNSLDVASKKQVMDGLKKLLAEYKRTCVFVTHDVDDALYLADDVVFLSRNRAEYCFSINGERNYGYEADSKWRKKLYGLLFDEDRKAIKTIE